MTPEEFKAIRKQLKFTQKKFSEMLGKGLRTIQDYEQGKYAVPVHVQKTIGYIMKIKREKMTCKIFPAVSSTEVKYPPLPSALKSILKPSIEIDIHPTDNAKDIARKLEKAINKSSEKPTSDE